MIFPLHQAQLHCHEYNFHGSNFLCLVTQPQSYTLWLRFFFYFIVRIVVYFFSLALA